MPRVLALLALAAVAGCDSAAPDGAPLPPALYVATEVDPPSGAVTTIVLELQPVSGTSFAVGPASHLVVREGSALTTIRLTGEGHTAGPGVRLVLRTRDGDDGVFHLEGTADGGALRLADADGYSLTLHRL